ncbi:hypothetical protein DVH24_034260 [Malus domestica]|uniref:CBS domain-containing protein n=1 Tax=Malus domestica TaxID=3750 RepID=A0A498IVY3_MALDO|nr:hypothetical protein DVH24_034260 [Malus domestica]
MKIKGEHREENIEESKLPLQLEESRSATKGSKEVRRIRGQQLAKQRKWRISLETFNEIQKLLSKTNGKFVGDLMTPAPLVVRETTNLEDAARLLLETKYRRVPVVDSEGKLDQI